MSAALFSSDLEQRSIAETELEATGITPSEILAKAYRRKYESIEVHERFLAETEVRRRRLHDDFDRLKAIRATPVEDAVVLGDE